ncbi:hypothetical protein [Kitasatospora azatica]|uniref:hypothetical protein n=1 Tax=Kitasatospora azatica TaxID=58347 RepID=UPI000AED96D2|nr:hypothetical protein [Kitasatospora azatica]
MSFTIECAWPGARAAAAGSAPSGATVVTDSALAAHALDLASSLSMLGSALREVIRYSEALAAEQEAEEIRHRLDNERAAIFEPLVGVQLALQARALANAD